MPRSSLSRRIASHPKPSHPGGFVRRHAPSCRGGASSVLRLAPTSFHLRPEGMDVAAWLERSLGQMAEADTDWTPDETCPSMITRLEPSGLGPLQPHRR
jgi:hypothetical protein